MRTIWWLLTGKKILRVFSFFHSEQPRMGRQHNRKIKLVDLQGVHFSNLKCQQRPLEDGLRKKGIKERWKLFNEIIVMASCASCFTMEKSDTVTSWTMSSSLTWNMKRKQTGSENQIRWPPKCTRAQDHNKIECYSLAVFRYKVGCNQQETLRNHSVKAWTIKESSSIVPWNWASKSLMYEVKKVRLLMLFCVLIITKHKISSEGYQLWFQSPKSKS